LFRRLWAIASNSFSEVIRQPVYGILLLSAMALTAFSPVITMFAMRENVKLLTDMGLATIFAVGLVLAVLSATRVISREIDSRTAGAVISKPVGRLVFVAGKFLGVSLAMAVATYLLTIILLMTVRMDVPAAATYTCDWPVFLGEALPFVAAMVLAGYANFFNRSNFTSTAVMLAVAFYTVAFAALCIVDKQWGLDSGDAFWIANTFIAKDGVQIFLAMVLVFLGVWVIAAIAVAASTRVNVVANVTICLALVFVGMISQYLFGWAVGYTAAKWAPVGKERSVVISGSVRDKRGEGVAGVRLKGLPGEPETGHDGSYSAQVRFGGWGTVKPAARGYTFSPPTRDYDNAAADLDGQDYAAVVREASVAGYLVGAGTAACWLAYHVVPSFQLFWTADQLMRPDPFVPSGYVGLAALYAIAWCGAMVAIGAFLFERRELI